MIALLALLVWHGYCDLLVQPAGKHEHPLRMAAHAAAHGLYPAIILGWQFGLAEVVAHALIDTGKGKGWYRTAIDQSLHVACKVVWVLLA